MLTIYEAIILLKNIPKDELALAIKRTSGYILQKKGFFRDMKYMGLNKTPFRISKEKNPFWEAHYLYYEFNAPKVQLPVISGEWYRDRDVIKFMVFPVHQMKNHDFDMCTFEDEMKPVPYRSHVADLVKAAERYRRRRSRSKMIFSDSFYPFQR